MKKVLPESPEDRKTLLLATLLNPEVMLWLGVALFGVAAAGWFLVGVGVLFAFIPLQAVAAIWFLKKRKGEGHDAF